MSEITSFFLLQLTLIAVVLVLHTYIGLHVIRRTLIFSDLVLDQLAAFGALTGLCLGISLGTPGSYLTSLGFVLLGAFLLAVVRPRSEQIPREAVIGIMYVMALVGCLLLGDKMAGGGTYFTKTLCGCMLWVSWPLVIVTIVVYVALLAFHYRFRSRFVALTEDDKAATHERLWDFLLFATQGIITVLIVPVAGVLLAYAFLMIPAGIALLFSRAWGPALVLGWSVGFLACLTGLCASFLLDWPYEPCLILSMTLFFLAAVVVRACLPCRG